MRVIAVFADSPKHGLQYSSTLNRKVSAAAVGMFDIADAPAPSSQAARSLRIAYERAMSPDHRGPRPSQNPGSTERGATKRWRSNSRPRGRLRAERPLTTVPPSTAGSPTTLPCLPKRTFCCEQSQLVRPRSPPGRSSDRTSSLPWLRFSLLFVREASRCRTRLWPSSPSITSPTLKQVSPSPTSSVARCLPARLATGSWSRSPTTWAYCLGRQRTLPRHSAPIGPLACPPLLQTSKADTRAI